MNINVTCEKHNVSMVVVREWAQSGNIEVTVEPCSECIEEAAKQSMQADEAILWVCKCGTINRKERGECRKCHTPRR